MNLSVVMPYFKRIREFQRVLLLNAPYFARPGTEVVIVLDEPSEEGEVMRLVRDFPSIRWRIIVNDFDHPWRPPCRAINVGVRNAIGEHVLVMSPESAFVTDVPGIALAHIAANPGTAALGHVAFATFDQVESAGGSLATAFTEPVTIYGSICVARERLNAIHGYDESFDQWGGDDDNLRVRLMMTDTYLFPLEDMRILHLSLEPRQVRQASAMPSPEYTQRIFSPSSAQANPEGWGESFKRIAFDWRR
ncbi:hypothetical protein FJV41_01770 [Myxococcus llanfairpwllgwyngyllgogerychwyrndrobwllllantysiliogogogochensis]|uniref:Galactosyltransferase C-terminal domain-containing protein n=1 Tax=Myxococcus llanfairpwllgwyngyllgogerychwyrndrobwllllantysiliogogogochensis TaxID=2590453 RepID=A0A540X8T5_9BACT|nr:galactosyltransferase-related protein [Myxococcus llanfairpwllgwyngyllgogerychwyrndrobwllllantysiliogogogochensis]TQF17721.1 hypothetical protein FJV41_01770 [Myxococcus llanfairpwllgwyngyllgogerychwyrndrobwllllantysiliogogogochensis]